MIAAWRLVSFVILAMADASTPSVAVAPLAVPTDPVLLEAVSRLRFELTDQGFAAPQPEAGGRADFVVGLERAGDRVVVSVTRPSRRTPLLRRVELPELPDLADSATDRSSIIAIRAVEILRATILQAADDARPRAPPASTHDRAIPGPVVAPATVRWALGAGISVLQSFRSFGTGFGPTAHGALYLAERVGIEVALSVPSLQRDLRAPDGSASIRQQTLAAAARYVFRSSRVLRPSVSLWGGLYHVSVDGSARVGAAVSSSLTTAFVAPAIGLTFTRGGWYAVQLEAQALFVQSSPYVTIGAADAEHAGRPLALVTLELEWRSGSGAGRFR